jgi:hypothetical protein
MTDPATVAPALHPRVALVLDELAAARSALRVLVDPLDDARLSQPAPDGGWSALEVLDHLAKSEEGISRMIRKLVRDALAQGLAAETESETASILASLLPMDVEGASRKVVAPPTLVPATLPLRADVLAALDESRARLVEWMRAGNGLALGTLGWPHPFFGPLTVYQWGVFVAQHERRHARQIARALAGSSAKP